MLQRLFLACLSFLLLVNGAAHAQVWNWSATATNNATVDNTINWAEGMPPSAVNDSARAVMARIAEWHADFAGNIVDTGSSSAYAVATSSGANVPTPTNNTRVVFSPANTNAAGVTLAVDGGTAYPIQSPLGTAIPAGIMIAHTPYAVVFNSANSVWLLEGNIQGGSGQLPNTGFVYPTRIAADISITNNQTPANLAGLSVAVANGGNYYFTADLHVIDPSTPGVQVVLSCTCTVANFIADFTYGDVSDGYNCLRQFTSITNTFTCGGSGGRGLVHVSGTLTTSSAGTLTVQGSQETSNAAATVFKRGSMFVVGNTQ